MSQAIDRTNRVPARRWRSLAAALRRALAALAALAGCSAPPPAGEGDGSLAVDETSIVHGAPSRGRDPSVVALLLGDSGLCSGTLVAPDLVLTARHCVSLAAARVTCPSRARQVQAERDPRHIGVLVGESRATGAVVAHGVAAVVEPSSSLCGEDLAVLVLDRAVGSQKVSPIASSQPLHGMRVRAVGFGRGERDVGAGEKRVREHVSVIGVDAREFAVGESTCSGDSGGPAFDEATGAVLGVVSRGVVPCDGPAASNTYSRVDAHRALLARALEHPLRSSRQGYAGTTSTPAPTAVGEPCREPQDCTTSTCVHEATGSYCSRTCGPGDRCPRGYRCRGASASRAYRVCQRHGP